METRLAAPRMPAFLLTFHAPHAYLIISPQSSEKLLEVQFFLGQSNQRNTKHAGLKEGIVQLGVVTASIPGSSGAQSMNP